MPVEEVEADAEEAEVAVAAQAVDSLLQPLPPARLQQRVRLPAQRQGPLRRLRGLLAALQLPLRGRQGALLVERLPKAGLDQPAARQVQGPALDSGLAEQARTSPAAVPTRASSTTSSTLQGQDQEQGQSQPVAQCVPAARLAIFCKAALQVSVRLELVLLAQPPLPL